MIAGGAGGSLLKPAENVVEASMLLFPVLLLWLLLLFLPLLSLQPTDAVAVVVAVAVVSVLQKSFLQQTTIAEVAAVIDSDKQKRLLCFFANTGSNQRSRRKEATADSMYPAIKQQQRNNNNNNNNSKDNKNNNKTWASKSFELAAKTIALFGKCYCCC